MKTTGALCMTLLILAWQATAAVAGRGHGKKGPLIEGYADGCLPPKLASWQAGPPRTPQLPGSQKPNFVVIQLDDWGFDDIGLLHPRGPDGVSSAGAQTPNIDKLMKAGMSFTNFYASPLCAMGRAQLLTGRDFPRTGNLFNTYGYDAFSLSEATMGDVMQQAGYTTAHYGKWHNGRASGYEPWSRGFNESWLPSEYVHLDNLMRHNGKYVQTKGLMEPALVDRMVNFMQRQQQAKQPVLIYYAPYAVHGIPVGIPNPSKPNASKDNYGPDGAYFNPEPYLSMVRQQLQGLPKPTDEWNLRFWAFLAYFDDVLGQLFNAVAASPWLASSTYIVLTSDNGADIPPTLTPYHRLRRMPSGMLGDKSDICEYITRVLHRKCESTGAGGEGALRTPLVVAGPGVPAGAVSDTLLNLADILPTVAQLAGAAAVNSQHQAWSGRSFANLLVPGGVEDAVQQDRVLFTLAVSTERKLCAQVWDVMTQLLPDLGPDRCVVGCGGHVGELPGVIG